MLNKSFIREKVSNLLNKFTIDNYFSPLTHKKYLLEDKKNEIILKIVIEDFLSLYIECFINFELENITLNIKLIDVYTNNDSILDLNTKILSTINNISFENVHLLEVFLLNQKHIFLEIKSYFLDDYNDILKVIIRNYNNIIDEINNLNIKLKCYWGGLISNEITLMVNLDELNLIIYVNQEKDYCTIEGVLEKDSDDERYFKNHLHYLDKLYFHKFQLDKNKLDILDSYLKECKSLILDYIKNESTRLKSN